jgi:hypothetical protein
VSADDQRRESGARGTALDEELLLWLGDEPPAVRAADTMRVREIAAEFARGFGSLAHVSPAVSVFGSARTPREHPDYALVRAVAAELGRAFVFAPGGFGTLDECFEALTLIQTGTIRHFPVIPIGTEEWDGLLDWLRERALADGRVNEDDMALFHRTDDAEEIRAIVDRASARRPSRLSGAAPRNHT